MELLQIVNDTESTTGLILSGRLSDRFFIRLAIDIVSVFILIRFIYFRAYRNKEFFFSYFIFNIIIFFITFLLNKVELSLGAAFGLFAVFSMLRYRTEGISMKDMTYLFLVIAIGLITAVAPGTWLEILLLNLFLLVFTFLLESNILMRKESSKIIQYDNIDMIQPDRREELIRDLEKRTGIKINRISIHKTDFLRDSATIQLYYYD
jgi:hypothetical protein